MSKIKASERQSIIQSLRSGQTPRIGLHHIQVGRVKELEQIAKDLDAAVSGAASGRFVIGDYGAGKTFFLNLAKTTALQKGFVIMKADLSLDRRLQGSDGQAVSLFNELTRNMATRTRPEGGALKSIIEKFIAAAVESGEQSDRSTREVIREKLAGLQDLVAGFDFADVLNLYTEGYEAQNEAQQLAALKWLRGEFNSKIDARKALGVRSMVDDDSFYDYLKLLARFCVLAGYKGLLVQLDEMASIFQLSSSQARLQNYEQILRILNDLSQGSAEHLVMMFGGTPEFLEDTRRGLYSHEPLRTRLAPSLWEKNGFIDYAHTVMRLPQLTREDLFALISKIRTVFSEGSPNQNLIGDDGLKAFIDKCFEKVGDQSFRTPRETAKQFVELLSLLEQYPESSWKQHLDYRQPMNAEAKNSKTSPDKREAELAELESFRL